MDYTFSNLLGAPYRGGSLVIHGDSLICPAGNRVREIQLRDSTSQTHAAQNGHQVRVVALSPDGSLMLSIDVNGRALLVLRKRHVLLHRFTLKAPCAAAKFSPDGSHIAIAVGKLVQVWKTPSKQKMVSPMQLLRTFGGCADEVTALDWSPDSLWLAAASKDITARVFSLSPIPGYIVPTLTGHRAELVAVFFASAATRAAAALDGSPVPAVYTVSADGALHGYTFLPAATGGTSGKRSRGDGSDESASDEDEGAGALTRQQPGASSSGSDACDFSRGLWKLTAKHYFDQSRCKLTAADYHAPTGRLVTAYSTGQFLLHQLPSVDHIHTLSISRDKISSATFNATGEWIALGCAILGQLLVWEWRSETYVLKQQGHYFDVSTVAFSPDGAYLATGADDCKVKIWSVSSGFCFVTFAEHRSAVTAVKFLPSSHAVLSASLDGTVRAFDLVRYRNFRTFTTPEPVQFVCLAIDASGEVICAGSKDTFQVFVWSMKTGNLLDVMAGHQGPVQELAFSPNDSMLASVSWDNTVRLWNVYAGDKSATDVLQHSHEVLAVAFHPSGKTLACSTLNGEIHFWDAQEAALKGSIECRRDIRGGRLMNDRRTAGNMSSGQAFTSLAYSPDGSFLLAAGTSKWVCVYDVDELVLLRRFQLSKNHALDGVLDQLNSSKVTDAGPLELLDTAEDDDDMDVLAPATVGSAAGAFDLPGTKGSGKRPVLRCRGLALSPSGATWAAATTEGVLLYSLSSAVIFDPTDLSYDISTPSVYRLLGSGAVLPALLVALRLNDTPLVQHVLYHTPAARIVTTASALPAAAVVPTLAALASEVDTSPHLEYVLMWARALCEFHGAALQAAPRTQTAPAFRLLQKALHHLATHLAPSVEQCLYKLSYLQVVSGLTDPAREGDADVEAITA